MIFLVKCMTITDSINIDRKTEMPIATCPLKYSSRLVRTINHLPEGYETAGPGMADFYDTLKVAAVIAVADGKPITPSTAGEEHQIYVQSIVGAEKLRDVEELRDYFANNDEGWYAWAHTLTGLRFHEADLRKPYNIGDKVTAEVIITDIAPYISQIADPKFTRENWKDIIEKINKVVAKLPVPYSRGHVIKEMHSTLDIFTEVEQTTEHKTPYALHGWLRENLDIPKDPISGHYEVAVGRGRRWHHVGVRCPDVGADDRRWDANSYVGFRPVVRGSVPGIQVVAADIYSMSPEVWKIPKD